MPPHVGGAQEKSGGAHQKNFGRREVPPPHLQIASDATDQYSIYKMRQIARYKSLLHKVTC